MTNNMDKGDIICLIALVIVAAIVLDMVIEFVLIPMMAWIFLAVSLYVAFRCMVAINLNDKKRARARKS